MKNEDTERTAAIKHGYSFVTAFLLTLSLLAVPALGQYEEYRLEGGLYTAYYGCSVSIDGDVALIGAYEDSVGQIEGGAAYVFRYDSGAGSWISEATLYPADLQYHDWFGGSVSVDGEIALIGTYDAEAAYVFRYNPGTGAWSEEEKLTASDGVWGDDFGHFVALSGEVALVGAPTDDDVADNAGSVYVFRYNPGSNSWVEETELHASDADNDDRFGLCVAFDGDIALIGSRHDDDNGSDSGSVYFFRYDPGSGSWTEEAKLFASDGSADDYFGTSVSLDLTSNVALIGSPADDDNGAKSGSAYVFRYDPGTESWVEEAKLLASDGKAKDGFGSVAVNGNIALVGAGQYGMISGGTGPGAAYLFNYDPGSGTWSQGSKLLASDGNKNDGFGMDVAISGNVSLVGAAYSNSDVAYIHDATMAPAVPDIKADGGDGPLSVPSTQAVTLTLSLDPGDLSAKHDYWVGAVLNGSSLFCWTLPGTWVACPGFVPVRAYSGSLVGLNNYAFHQGTIPTGTWSFAFAVDIRQDKYEGTYKDTIQITSY